MDEYIISQNQGRVDYGMNNSYVKGAGSHITQSLKNHVKEVRAELAKKDEEMAKIKRSLKATNIQELEVEMKLYVDECTRLRHMLEESYKNAMDPAEMAKLQEQFQMQENYIINLQNENQELAETCAKMQQIMQSQQDDKEDSKLRAKLSRIMANKKKLTKNLKVKERELSQLKKDLADARLSSKGGSSTLKTLNDRLNKYQKDVEDKNKTIAKLHKELADKNNIIARLQNSAGPHKSSPAKEQLVKAESLKSERVVKQSTYDQQREQDSRPSDASDDRDDNGEPDERDEQDEQDDQDEYADDYEDNSKDRVEQQDPNIIDDDEHDDDAKNNNPKGELKAIISDIEVDPLFDKLKL